MRVRASQALDKSLEHVACDFCGKSNEKFLYTKKGALTGYPFRVVRCRSCGLIYLNPRMDEQSLSELYDYHYYDGKGFDPGVRYLEETKKEDKDKFLSPNDTLEFIKEFVPPPAALLDFGCGLGDFIRQASCHGYEAEGFEVSRFATELLKNNGIRVYTEFSNLPRERFNVVTAIEVLEHCYSPMKALRSIYDCLKPGGLFYYVTCNFDGFYYMWRLGIKDKSRRDDYIMPEGHIYFFTTSVMKAYLKKVGFSQLIRNKTHYHKNGRLFKLLSKISLINDQREAPQTFLEKIIYYGGRRIYQNLFFYRGFKPLPLARK